MVTNVSEHTIELKNFITQTNIRLNFAHLISTLAHKINVIIKNSARLHIMKMKYRLSLLRSISLTWISTYFISRLFGVLTERTIMTVRRVFMHIIGKTIAESLHYIAIRQKCARIGTPIRLLHPTTKAVNNNIFVCTRTAGKNKSIIPSFSKQRNASTALVVLKYTALIFIQILTKERHFQTGSISFPRRVLTRLQQISMYLHLVKIRTRQQTSKLVFHGYQLKLFRTRESSEETPHKTLSPEKMNHKNVLKIVTTKPQLDHYKLRESTSKLDPPLI